MAVPKSMQTRVANTTGIPTSHTHTHVQITCQNGHVPKSWSCRGRVCDVGMPVVFVIIRIPPLFAYFLALPYLFPSAITIIVFLYLLL